MKKIVWALCVVTVIVAFLAIFTAGCNITGDIDEAMPHYQSR